MYGGDWNLSPVRCLKLFMENIAVNWSGDCGRIPWADGPDVSLATVSAMPPPLQYTHRTARMPVEVP